MSEDDRSVNVVYLNHKLYDVVHLDYKGGLSMAEEFLSDEGMPPVDSPRLGRDREPIRLLLVGFRQGITTMIQTLHHLNVAQPYEWSQLTPEPCSGKLMSVMTRYIRTD